MIEKQLLGDPKTELMIIDANEVFITRKIFLNLSFVDNLIGSNCIKILHW